LDTTGRKVLRDLSWSKKKAINLGVKKGAYLRKTKG